MHQARVFAFGLLLIGCQSRSIQNATVRWESHVQEASARGWTIDETMKVRHVDNVRISTDRRRVLFVVRAAALSSDKGEYQTRIYTADANGTNERPLTPAEYSTTAAEWSPDGRWIAFLSNGVRKSEGNSIWLIPAEGGRPHQIDIGGTGVTNLKWSPTGGQIAFTMAAVQAAQPRAQQDPAAPQVMDAAVPSTQLWVVGVSSDGTALDPPRALTSVRLHVHTGTDFGNPFEWSPSGKAIVFAHNANADWWSSWPSTGISIVDVASGHTRSLAGPAMAPSYSPDGRWVAYLGGAGRYAPHILDVFVVSADGGEPRKLAETFDRHPTLIGWSADGGRLYVNEARRTVTRLSALPLTGERVVDLDPGDAVLGAVALDPSRTMVAFTRQTLAQPVEAYLTPLDEFHAVRVSGVNAALPAHALPRTEVLRWKSFDGAVIEGLLTYPMDYDPGRRYPLVVAVHAGGQAFQQTFVANPFPLPTPLGDSYPVTELAMRGYAILRCNSRGGVLAGYGAENSVPWFRVKEKAYPDVMSGVNEVIQRGIADSGRVGIAGFSNGALVVSWIITQTSRFKAAIVYAGFPDLVAAAGSSIAHDLGAEPWENARAYAEHSPLLHIASLTTPTLLLHGERDQAVPVSQGYAFYRALKRRGVPTEMVVYPGEGHVVSAPKYVIDIGRRHVEWMDRHLRNER